MGKSAPLPCIERLRVLDLGMGMSTALVAKFFGDMGARVTRVSHADDPFDAIYPAYSCWHARSRRAQISQIPTLASTADVIVTGGESFPGVEPLADPLKLQEAYPRAIIIDLRACLGPDKSPAVDILAQARTGFAYEHRPDRPIHFAWPGPTYGAVLLALVGAFAALLARQTGKSGRIVEASLQQGAALWWSVFWMSAKQPDPHFQPTIVPKGVKPLIFRCADGAYIHFVTRAPGDLAKLYDALGIVEEVDPLATGMVNLDADNDNYYGDTALYASHVSQCVSTDLLAALWDRNIAAEVVYVPGACWDDKQTAVNGVVEQRIGGSRGVGLPIRLAKDEHGSGLPTSLISGTLPLAGLRVVDFGHLIAGPFASRLLADLGADVIKVEPLSGDLNRSRYRSHVAGGIGKRSIAIDAKAAEGRAIIAALCERADACHHNLRPGAAERLGLGVEDLRKLRPGIVTLETSAYGSTGPKSLNSGYDMIMQAYCGLELRNGGKDEPLWSRAWIVDYATGSLGAIALLAGLLQQATDGSAVASETSLLDAGIFLVSDLVQNVDGVFCGAELNDNMQLGPHPAERLYATSDGWIAVAARSAEMAARFSDALGVPISTPRNTWGTAEADRLENAIAKLTTTEVLQRLATADVWSELCVEDGWQALMADPQASPIVSTLVDPLWEEVTCVDGLVQFEPRAPKTHRVAPQLGEQTREILLELGFQSHEIDDLIERKIVRIGDSH